MTTPAAHQARAISPAQLKDLSIRSHLPGLVRSVSHYGAIALVGLLLWQVKVRYGIWWTVPLVVVQGYLVAFLFMPLHEAAHKTVFKDRRMNVALGQMSGLTIAYPYEYYTLFHWDHHRFTQDPDRDPELLNTPIPTSDTKLAIAYSGIVQLTNRIRLMLRHAITGRVVARWIPQDKRPLIVLEARVYLAIYIALLVASVALATTVLLWTWLIPLVVGQIFLRPYLLAEHTGCEHTRSAFENTRTTYTGAVMKWFAWNMPYHVEHHAYPSVPFHALPTLHAAVADRIVHHGHGYKAVTRDTWRWFRRARTAGRLGV